MQVLGKEVDLVGFIRSNRYMHKALEKLLIPQVTASLQSSIQFVDIVTKTDQKARESQISTEF